MRGLVAGLLPMLLLLPGATCAGDAWRLSGSLSAQINLFPSPPLLSEQVRHDASLAAEPEFYREWADGAGSFTFTPFYRLDSAGGARSHGDLRELHLYGRRGNWEWRVGVTRVFWGVAESNHLIDVINQVDALEDLDGEDRLGQPMIQIVRVLGDLELEYFLLAGFRERAWPEPPDRLRFALPVAENLTRYESARRDRHVDHALRMTGSFGDLELGGHLFYGTARMPRLEPALDDAGRPVLVPVYELARRIGLEALWLAGDWTWKFEAIRERRGGRWYDAAVGGFEYTFYDLAGSGWDLGALLEYSHDSRGLAALTPLQDDLFLGMRLAFNDAQSSELLFGLFHDLELGSEMWRLEASRRLGENWKLVLEGQAFLRPDPRDLLYAMRADDYLRIELGWYF